MQKLNGKTRYHLLHLIFIKKIRPGTLSEASMVSEKRERGDGLLYFLLLVPLLYLT